MPQCQFLFSTIFVFQKSYTGNILRIGWNEARSSYFSPTREGVQSRDEGEPGAGHTIGWCGSTPGRATRWFGPLVHPLTSPFRLYILSETKTLNESTFFQIKFRNAAAIADKIRGTEVSIPAPCRDGELPPEPSPSSPPPSSSPLLTPMMRRE
jgi:hypothetical protein